MTVNSDGLVRWNIQPLNRRVARSDPAGFPLVFGVGSERELSCDYGYADSVLDADDQWVFVRPRK